MIDGINVDLESICFDLYKKGSDFECDCIIGATCCFECCDKDPCCQEEEACGRYTGHNTLFHLTEKETLEEISKYIKEEVEEKDYENLQVRVSFCIPLNITKSEVTISFGQE